MPDSKGKRRIWGAVHAIVGSPWAAIVVGLLVVWVSGEQLIGQAGETAGQLNGGANLGMLLLGLLEAAFALGFILTGMRFVGFGVLQAEEGKSNRVLTAICRTVHHPLVAVAVGLAIVLSGVFATVYEMFTAGQTGAPTALSAGVIMLGVWNIACRLGNALVGLEVLDSVETETSWHGRLIHRLERWARRPWVEVALAAVIIGLGIWQSISSGPGAAKGMLALFLLSAYQLIRSFPALFMGAFLADEALAPVPAAAAAAAGGE
jgi:hypothetical protein